MRITRKLHDVTISIVVDGPITDIKAFDAIAHIVDILEGKNIPQPEFNITKITDEKPERN